MNIETPRGIIRAQGPPLRDLGIALWEEEEEGGRKEDEEGKSRRRNRG